jgi:hemerythrin-like domain-containing protein
MDSISIMKQEHRLIERMLKVVRQMCMALVKGHEFDLDDFYEVADFISQYADEHHHGKEEKFLFKEMEDRLGKLGKQLIRGGMYIEHDLGRLYKSNMLIAVEKLKAGEENQVIEVIGYAMSYVHLLERHIAKEDEVIYTFGTTQLSDEVLQDINQKTHQFEQSAKEKGIQEYYHKVVATLEGRYNLKH